MPKLNDGSLFRNQSGYASGQTASLVIDTGASTRIGFTGNYFIPTGRTLITYGPLPNANQYTCDLVPEASSAQAIACDTFGGSQGTNLHFRVTVVGQTVVSTFAIAFPTTPTVESVRGCALDATNDENMPTTAGCPTEGGVTLLITGTNFAQSGLAVSVGGSECTIPVASSSTALSCRLPASNGGLDKSVVVTANGQPSRAIAGVSYSNVPRRDAT